MTEAAMGRPSDASQQGLPLPEIYCMIKHSELCVYSQLKGHYVYLCPLYVHAIEISYCLGVEGHCWEDVRISDDTVE